MHLPNICPARDAHTTTGHIRHRIVFGLMLAAFLFGGCGIHLHRSEDALLSRTASASFKDAKLEDALKSEFDTAAQILNDEIAAIRHQSSKRAPRQVTFSHYWRANIR